MQLRGERVMAFIDSGAPRGAAAAHHRIVTDEAQGSKVRGRVTLSAMLPFWRIASSTSNPDSDEMMTSRRPASCLRGPCRGKQPAGRSCGTAAHLVSNPGGKHPDHVFGQRHCCLHTLA